MQAAGGVAREEMDRVFNMGVGMIVAVDSSDVSVILDAAAACGVEGWTIGSTVEGEGVTYL
jgi:phosphoribosylformylglycinamidine cyclo-ligase